MNSTEMVVMQIVRVDLKPRMASVLSFNTHNRVTDWLKHWTCRANFKAVIAPDRESALQHCQQMLRKQLVPSWLARESGIKASMFTFQVSEQTAKDNEFWMSSQAVWVHDHEIGEDEE